MGSPREFEAWTLARAAGAVGAREVSPQELIAFSLERIQELNDTVRAFITAAGDEALARAQEIAKDAVSVDRPPLLGVPVSLKDLYDTRALKTTAGSRVFAGRQPGRDATVAQKLERAGAILIGKTNLHEFAYGVTNINDHYGTARNPWNRDRICGGSSGGSACAVALSMGFASLGSDTGGSIRIPASLCGIVGFKPTYGRVSLNGVVPLSWSLDHAGPMTKNVEDAALLLGVIAGHDPLDERTRAHATPNYMHALTGDIKGIRIGIPTTYFYERVDPEVHDAVRAAVRKLETSGARLVEIDLPSISVNRPVWNQIAAPEVYSFHEPLLRKHRELYGAGVRARIEAGRPLLSIDYVRAQRVRTVMRKECTEAFEKADVLVTPTTPFPAPLIAKVHEPWSGDSEPASAALTRFTRFFNIAGLPAISIPCGFTSEGLPIGMQIAGRAFDESTVLRVAYAYEQEAAWFKRRPPA